MKTLIKNIIAISICALAFAACQKDGHIYLDSTSVAFADRNNEPVIIKVLEASSGWSASSNNSSWIEVETISDGIKITVTENTDFYPREGSVVFKAGSTSSTVKVTQSAASNYFARYRKFAGVQVGVFSASGTYFGGFEQQVLSGDIYEFTPFVINVLTDKKTTFGPYKNDEKGLSFLQATAVSDDGKLFLIENRKSQCALFDINTPDTYTFVQRPTGFADRVLEEDKKEVGRDNSVEATADNGRIWFGLVRDMAADYDKPRMRRVKWVDGGASVLEMPEN